MPSRNPAVNGFEFFHLTADIVRAAQRRIAAHANMYMCCAIDGAVGSPGAYSDERLEFSDYLCHVGVPRDGSWGHGEPADTHRTMRVRFLDKLADELERQGAACSD